MKGRIVPLIVGIASVGLAASGAYAQTMRAPPRVLGDTMLLTSPTFVNGAELPRSATCEGRGVSPPLSVTGTPAQARSLAITVEDRDALNGHFAHWVAWNLPGQTVNIPEGAGNHEGLGLVHGMIQGRNAFGHVGYGGACPPVPTEHHYRFRVYALDKALTLPEGSDAPTLRSAIRGHVLGEATLDATYSQLH